jgi:putative phosphoesterase
VTTIAIVSDIHANLVALEAVLAELGRVQPDRVICLGDVAATGPAPRAVLARLRELDWRFVRGNCDDDLLEFAANLELAANDEHEEIDRWCALQLDANELAFLAAFEPVVEIEVEGNRICAFHGSPQSNLDELYRDTSDEQLDAWFAGHDAVVFAGGHTHVQMVRRFRSSYVINPGSIGLPFTNTADGREVNPAWAEIALVRINGAAIAVELRRVPVDRERTLQMARESEMPCFDWWGGDWE